MSFAFIGMMILLGFSKTTAFVLHPSNEEPAAPAISSLSQQRCKDESLQSIRKGLLRALNLQAEPQLPAGGIDSVREQWQRTIGFILQAAKKTAPTDYSVSHDSGNRTGLTCCSVASEISMKDLGWDSWVIHPLSLTFVQCALCNPADGTMQCPSSSSSVQGASSQVVVVNSQLPKDPLPCCQPAVQETLNIVYMDEIATIVISPIEVNRSCGCGPGNAPQPSTE
ncbi:growth/differentiation factor 7-like isoform X2 [Poecilia latipinna]|uniref:growth/differentiation factor 7-like isoform X2 n=1 Tax=Poecilia latipinna TaxID=48699 RepID=UPI00072E65F7|nr:PREDICTED: growth/differentiation factor 7-like isoform X2 [Poecilia latipinna]